MIAADQPAIFPKQLVRTVVSSVEDGSMKDGTSITTPEATARRKEVLEASGMPHDQTAVFYANFDSDDFCRYKTAQPGLMPKTDAVATAQVGVPMLLPVADCTAAIIYDPAHHALMMSHLGRHSTEQYGGVRSVEYLTAQYDSDPADLLVWLSPSPGGDSYPLWQFDNRSFTDVLREQFLSAGVAVENMEVSGIDTATNPHYFSHSQFLKGQQDVDGRYAVAAMLL